jgi:outer membrane murein-binding lipoprotein Lpp
MAVVATVSALVLGLLISNANTSFRTLGGDVTTLSAQILRLDNILRRYGPDTYAARETLRQYAKQKTVDLFPDEGADVRLDNPSTYALLQRLEDSMLELKPSNARDQWWLDQAMTLAGKIGDTRWLLVQQLGQGTPKAFLALLVFWLTLTVRQFWSVRAAQLYIWGDPDAMRPSSSWCRWNDPGIGKRLRGTSSHLATADAPGCQGFRNPIK